MWIKNYGLAALNVKLAPFMVISISNVMLMNATHILFGTHAQGILTAL